MQNRRRFLQSSTLAASVSLVGCASPRSTSLSPRPARLGPGQPARIIHIVSDGMSLGTLTCAEHLRHLETGRSTAWIGLQQDPAAVPGLMDTRSLNSLVTDSAAAASSWGCGAHVQNGKLNVSSSGLNLTPLTTLLQQAGWRRALVTTTEITHATPAGFAVNVPDRGQGEEIARQLLDRQLDLLLGGALPHFDPAKRKDQRDLLTEARTAGYQVLRSREDLQRAPLDTPWLGLFASGHLPYSIDRDASPELQRTVPTLAEMTARALQHLERHDHFFLMVEGGRIDHACHNNDAAGALRDQLALDDALAEALAFQRRHPDTLLVVTTDHGNANLGLNGLGTSYGGSSAAFQRLTSIHASFPEILRQLKATTSVADARTLLAELTGYQAPEAKFNLFHPFLADKGSALFDQMNSAVAALGQLLANHTGIGFSGTSHTSDYAPLLALGPGADRFRGYLANVDVFRHYTALAGIDHQNPREPFLASSPFLSPAPATATENIAAYALA